MAADLLDIVREGVRLTDVACPTNCGNPWASAQPLPCAWPGHAAVRAFARRVVEEWPCDNVVMKPCYLRDGIVRLCLKCQARRAALAWLDGEGR